MDVIRQSDAVVSMSDSGCSVAALKTGLLGGRPGSTGLMTLPPGGGVDGTGAASVAAARRLRSSDPQTAPVGGGQGGPGWQPQCEFVPHGVPDLPFCVDKSALKAALGFHPSDFLVLIGAPARATRPFGMFLS